MKQDTDLKVIGILSTVVGAALSVYLAFRVFANVWWRDPYGGEAFVVSLLGPIAFGAGIAVLANAFRSSSDERLTAKDARTVAFGTAGGLALVGGCALAFVGLAILLVVTLFALWLGACLLGDGPCL